MAPERRAEALASVPRDVHHPPRAAPCRCSGSLRRRRWRAAASRRCPRAAAPAAAPAAAAGQSRVAPVAPEGAVSVVTKNTTRLGGADPASDAAAVARAVYPALTTATRPQAVVLVGRAQLGRRAGRVGARERAAERAAPVQRRRHRCPKSAAQTLEAMRPTGSPAVGGAQVIRSGPRRALPGGFARARSTAPRGDRRRGGRGRAAAGGCPRRASTAGDRGGGATSRARCRCPRPAWPPRAARRSCSSRRARRPGGDERGPHAAAAARRSTSWASRRHRRRHARASSRASGRSRRSPSRGVADGADAGRERDRGGALHRRRVRLGRQRTGPRARVRERDAAARRARRGAAVGDRRLRAAAAGRQRPTPSPPRAGDLPERHPAGVHGRAPVSSRCAASTITAG